MSTDKEHSNLQNFGGPTIAIHAGISELFGYSFFIWGQGFLPGSTVTIDWQYKTSGSPSTFTQHPDAANVSVGSGGTFSDIVECAPVKFKGTLSVRARDKASGLSAEATENVT
jgi:hypothetical protein